jgi:hypothetical protein
METTMTAIIVAAQGQESPGRTETCARASMKAKARPGERWRMISHRARRLARPWHKTRGVQLAISMSQMADRSAPIYASVVKGDGDSFTLIWSRRNGD